MNIGEAGGILVLEELERARRRGATIYAEVAGYGITCEAYHPTAPEPEGAALAETLTAALRDARVDHDANRPRQRPWDGHPAERPRRGERASLECRPRDAGCLSRRAGAVVNDGGHRQRDPRPDPASRDDDQHPGRFVSAEGQTEVGGGQADHSGSVSDGKPVDAAGAGGRADAPTAPWTGRRRPAHSDHRHSSHRFINQGWGNFR